MLQSSAFNVIHRIFSTSRPFHVVGIETRMLWIFLPVLLLFSVGGKLHASKSQQLAFYLRHPQEQFCSADFAVYAKVLPKNHTEEGEKHKIRVYDLEILKIYKGVDFLTANQTNVTVNGVQVNSSNAVGLPVRAYASGVKLKHNTEYLLIGIIKDEKIRLNLGSMLEQWSQVTPAYRAGISGIYAQNCECQITPCFGKPCKPLKGCDVPPRQLREFYQGCKWRHSYCVEDEAGSACSWDETGAEYITCTSEIP